MHAQVKSSQTQIVWHTPQLQQQNQQPQNAVESGLFHWKDFTVAERKKAFDEMTAEPSETESSYGRQIWKFIKKQWKKILAIILIFLDVIFDWMEYSEMSSEGVVSTSNKKETVSCTARGDNLAEKFMIFTVLGTLFAVVQIANITFQIYTEERQGRALKLMDGRTEVVISRLFEEIPQILLIIAFRAECNISCVNQSGRNVKAVLSTTLSILSSIWRHMISSPSTKRSCGEKCLRCWFPYCFWKCRCYPCGRIFTCECCQPKCLKWGCESEFLSKCCVVRCYPTHLNPPKTKYIECCARTNELNCLTRQIMKLITIVHVLVYVIFILNIYCLFPFMVYIEVAANKLF